MKLVLILALSCSLGACHKSGSGSSTNKSKTEALDPSQFLKLQSFASCYETDEYLRVNIRAMIKKSIDSQREYLNQNNPETVTVNDAAETTADSKSGPEDFTKTNVQVEGVDEPDIIKTNGTHIFAISGSQVHITQTWPAETMQILAKINVSGYPVGLMLTEKNQLIVAYHGEMKKYPSTADYPWYYYWNYNYNLLNLDVYDVSQAQAPLLVKKMSFAGKYSTMRRQGDLLRIVQNNWNLPMMSGIQSYINTYDSANRKTVTPEEFDILRAEVEQSNEIILSTLTMQSFLKNWRSAITSQTTDDALLGDRATCQNIFASKAFDQLGFTTISSINLANFDVAQSGLFAPVSMVYSSVDSLYLANVQRGSWWGWNQSQGVKTFIHKFKYENPNSVNLLYQGSGAVDGYPVNQFALDEYQNNLRVAVTDTNHVVEGQAEDKPPVFTTINKVYVLASNEAGLGIIGQTRDLAAGERVYSARFDRNKGYVVTFRQVDPLFTLDLSDPTSPQVKGELKVNGFSSYIHLLDDNHLLTVGQDADPSSGRTRGLKISVFDVSDPSQPKETFNHLINNGEYSWSEAQYDHKAFTYFVSRGLLSIPVGGYRKSTASQNWYDSYFSELMVFKIDLQTGITPSGSIAMNDVYRGKEAPFQYWWYGSKVRRSVFADDYIYAISDMGIRAVKNSDLSTSIQTISFYP